MKIVLAAAAFLLAAAPAFAGGKTPEKAEAKVEAYAPMAPFAQYDGRTFRGEWTDEKGERLVDTAEWKLILNGRALQSTHRLQNSTYGGRTIFFWDEGAKKYVFHYFTTAGFHTTGKAEFKDGGLVTEEAVEGHATIGSVRSKVIFGKDEMAIDVVYVGKDGTETPGGHRIYRPVADGGRLFPDTE